MKMIPAVLPLLHNHQSAEEQGQVTPLGSSLYINPSPVTNAVVEQGQVTPLGSSLYINPSPVTNAVLEQGQVTPLGSFLYIT